MIEEGVKKKDGIVLLNTCRNMKWFTREVCNKYDVSNKYDYEHIANHSYLSKLQKIFNIKDSNEASLFLQSITTIKMLTDVHTRYHKSRDNVCAVRLSSTRISITIDSLQPYYFNGVKSNYRNDSTSIKTIKPTIVLKIFTVQFTCETNKKNYPFTDLHGYPQPVCWASRPLNYYFKIFLFSKLITQLRAVTKPHLMLLSRTEHELTKPKNWGKITYDNIKRRQNVPEKFIASHIRDMLDLFPVLTGTLDGTLALNELNENDQCDFFSKYSVIQELSLKNWISISSKVLRCISITCSEQLLSVDLSNSKVNDTELQVLLVRCTKLKKLKLNDCQGIDTNCLTVVVKLLNQTLEELHLSRCNRLTNESLLWIGGGLGFKTQSLANLRCLDLGESPVMDIGLSAVAKGCRKLRYLNLLNCANITDQSMVQIAKSGKHLLLLNISGCYKVSNKSIIAIGNHCSELTSLNLSRCPLINDVGVKAVAMGCQNLQAINLAGLLKMTEDSMVQLGENCKGLLMMNLTGCEKITLNGLESLIRGLKYVEAGVTFMGFKPIENHVEEKLSKHLIIMEGEAVKIIQEGKIKQQKKVKRDSFYRNLYLNNAAKCIQNYLHRYHLRMHYYRLWRNRIERTEALLIQRVYRGYRGRLQYHILRDAWIEFLTHTPYAIQIQYNVRGYLCRLHTMFVKRAILDLRAQYRRDAETVASIRIQSFARVYLAKIYLKEYRELENRRRLNQSHAILIIQMLIRRYLAIKKLIKLRNEKSRVDEARRLAALKIKSFTITKFRRYKSRLTGAELIRYYRHKWTAAITIQSIYRGYRVREEVKHMFIDWATYHYAAQQIQRIFRGSRVLPYHDIKLNVIAAFVFDRQYLERRDRIRDARSRYQQYLEEVKVDSASESEDEDEQEKVVWIKSFDGKRKVYSWEHLFTGEITYDEPVDVLAQEKGLVGKRIKVFWTIQNAWYEGSITRYHMKKQRHRIEYDDGDHEWMNVKEECDRVQIQREDGTWCMYLLYQSPELLHELQKIQNKKDREDFKKQAFKDALQWQLISNPGEEALVYLSNLNGVLRTGVPTATEWIVQDDGMGYPCFCNQRNGSIVYEDPRFLLDVDQDVARQRKHVMQELRFALYLCRDLWDNYCNAVALRDNKQIYSMLMAIKNSPKPMHLSTFVIRAKGLYQQISIVDRPVDKPIFEELEYANWLSERLAEVIEKAHDAIRNRKETRRKHVVALLDRSGKEVHCQYCGRVTKRHLEYCPNCGKQQVFIK